MDILIEVITSFKMSHFFFMTQILNTGSQNIINTITKITNKYNSEQNIHVFERIYTEHIDCYRFRFCYE